MKKKKQSEAPSEDIGMVLRRFLKESPYFDASSKFCSKEKLAEYSTNPSTEVRIVVAKNPATSPKILKNLLTDQDALVRSEAAKVLLVRKKTKKVALSSKDLFNCACALTANNLDALALFKRFSQGDFHVES